MAEQKTLGIITNHLRKTARHLSLTQEARAELRRDRLGLSEFDPGVERTIEQAMEWLYRAQDESKTKDGGVARSYSLLVGWESSYPETTGYIIPTFLDYAHRSGDQQARTRARRMLEWLERIQLPCGGFQGGKIDAHPVVPVTFNTGQILLGLAAGEAAFGTYREPMRRAADWLVQTQDPDGCWRKYPSPFANPGQKTYDTHVAWGLLEAARIDPGRGYAEAALANIDWALRHQDENGWFNHCYLEDSQYPSTHPIGYALRGVIEGYRFNEDRSLLEAARKTADGVLSAMHANGFLPGSLREDWSANAHWACLTGTAQIAYCWLMLHRYTGDLSYRNGAIAANSYVRRTVRIDNFGPTKGAVKGSFPVDGAYGAFEYPNWASKFLIDALMLEADIRNEWSVPEPG